MTPTTTPRSASTTRVPIAARYGAAMVAVLAGLVGACSTDPASSPSGDSDNPVPSESDASAPTPEVFDPDEPVLPGGVRVLSRAAEDFVALDGGRYGVRVSDSLLYQVDVPDDSEAANGVYLNPSTGGHPGRNGILWIAEAGPDTALPADPCHDHTTKVVGPTVEDLALALSDQPFLTVTRPVEVTVGGMKGLLVKATVPNGAHVSACQGGEVDLISEHHSAGAGDVERLWILDIDGARHVIHAKVNNAPYATNANKHARAMTQMVKSITFTHG